LLRHPVRLFFAGFLDIHTLLVTTFFKYKNVHYIVWFSSATDQKSTWAKCWRCRCL